MIRNEQSQFQIPITPEALAIDPTLIANQPTMTRALHLCQLLSGKDDAQFYGSSGIVKDQAQWSRIMGAGQHHFPHDKLNLFMDIAGNEAPMLWLLHSRDYDLETLRKTETETQRELRLVRQENDALRRVMLGKVL